MTDSAPDTAAGWEPVKSDDAGNVWEWSFRDGKGARIIVGPTERVYIESLHQRIDSLVSLAKDMASLLSELDRHDRHVVTNGKWTSGMRHRLLAVLDRWVRNG